MLQEASGSCYFIAITILSNMESNPYTPLRLAPSSNNFPSWIKSVEYKNIQTSQIGFKEC